MLNNLYKESDWPDKTHKKQLKKLN